MENLYISPFCSQLFDKALQLHEEIDKSLGMPHETFESWVGQHRPYLASIGPTSPASALPRQHRPYQHRHGKFIVTVIMKLRIAERKI